MEALLNGKFIKMKITAKTKICMVIGDPVEHSLSPQIHNACYEALGVDGDFVYVACRVKVEEIGDFIKGVRAMGVRGVSCTIPHKIEVMKHLDVVDDVAKKIGAVNTVVNDNGVLKGYNTDWLGVVHALEKITPLDNKRVALIGAGGAARAVAYGVTARGARLVVFNRTVEKARELAEEFGGEGWGMEEIGEIGGMDIIFNATSVGMQEDESPVPGSLIRKDSIVFDAIYTPRETRLLREAKEAGARVIYGFEMLLGQALGQFRIYTGLEAREDVMRRVLLDALEGKGG